MKNMLKRIVALCCVCLFSIMSTATSVYAADDCQKEMEYYVYKYGDREIQYLLDEKMQPYYEANGERIYLALPLEHLRITDDSVLADLNRGIQNAISVNSSDYEPPEYHDLALQPFERTMYLNANYKYTDIMKMNMTKQIIRIKTSEEEKNSLFGGKLISYVIAYYCVEEKTWHKISVENSDCSISVGQPFDVLSPQLHPYVYYGIKSEDLYSAKVTCWCTDV